jgi:hypothetical protein
MTLPRSLLSEERAREIKEQLWAGHMTQAEIAHQHYVSQSTISRIFRGYDWAHLPWPDGSLGHIPQERRTTIHASRHRSTRYKHDTRTGKQELSDKETSEINSVVEQLLTGDDAQLRDTITKKATETRRRATSSQGKKFTGDMLPWLDIKEADPGHPIVQELITLDDPPLKVALRIVCAKVPQSDWQKPSALAMIDAEAEKIRAKIA